MTFGKLENDIAFFSDKGQVLLCGDFNARTGGLNDYIQNDDMNYNIKDCPVPPTCAPE